MPFLFSSAGLKLAAIAISLLVIVAWWTHKKHQIEQAAVARVVAQYEAAAARESHRREQVIQQAQRQAEIDASRLAAKDQTNVLLRRQIDRLSRRHDHERCLDADSVRQLDQVGREAGH